MGGQAGGDLVWPPAAGYQRYAEALGATAAGVPGATELLQAVVRDSEQPAIARASALARLGPSPILGVRDVVRAGLKDGDPLVRRAAVSGVEGADPVSRVELLAPLLAITRTTACSRSVAPGTPAAVAPSTSA